MAVKVTGRPYHTTPPQARRFAGRPRSQWQAILGMLLLAAGLAAVYVWYLRAGDVSPDSLYGYIFAIAGTVVLVLVGVGYTLRKRLRGARWGLLHTALSWHMVGGVVSLALIFMHAVGNFHPRTGTYALYALIALVVSGIIGKQLDRVAPRRAAKAALRTVTADGEERLEALVGALDTKLHSRRKRSAASQPRPASANWEPWDLAYYDMSVTPDVIPSLLAQQGQRSAHAAASGTSAVAAESDEIRLAINSERFYLRVIRVWRALHTVLSVLTLVLILWHLEFAATLLWNAR